MPLIKSKSEQALKTNIKTLMGEIGKSPHVQSREQALAISYAMKRRARADGGVSDADPEPVQAGAQYAQASGPYQIRPSGNGQFQVLNIRTGQIHFTGTQSGAANAQATLMSRNRKRGGALDAAYKIRRAEGGPVHEGPIMSSVPGRTDHHDMDVAAGSYVLPAHVVSGLGQGNTMAGMEKIRTMFPDRHAARLAHGGQVPGSAVPIAAAGGEVVLTPEQIIAKYGNLKRGHQMLDKFCKTYTKKLVKQISKLPGPAKD